MRVYVDFDDVLCETARSLSLLCARLLNRPVVPYGAIHAFDLRASFNLSETEYETLMSAAHTDAAILSYAPAPNAAETLRAWQAAGLATTIVTGRPPSTRAASLEWLRRNGFPGEIPILFLDKYNRHARMPRETTPPMSMDAFEKIHFDVAVEDAPAAIVLLLRRPACRVIVFARPWNAGRHPALERHASWRGVARALRGAVRAGPPCGGKLSC